MTDLLCRLARSQLKGGTQTSKDFVKCPRITTKRIPYGFHRIIEEIFKSLLVFEKTFASIMFGPNIMVN